VQVDSLEIAFVSFLVVKREHKVLWRNESKRWRSKKGEGGKVEARALGRRPWGRNKTLFAVIINVFLSRNFRPKYV